MPSYLVNEIKEVTVGPFTYSVKFSNKKTKKGPFIVMREQRIVIPADGGDDVKLEGLVHEIFHAIWDQLNLGKKSKEEAAIWPMSVLWLDTLQRNPKLVEAIQP